MTTKTSGYENYHSHTRKNGMYNFISLCGYSFLNVGTHFSMWVIIKNEYGP